MSSPAGGTRAPFALVVSLPGRLHVHASSMADAAELASAQLAREAPSAIMPGSADWGAPAWRRVRVRASDFKAAHDAAVMLQWQGVKI